MNITQITLLIIILIIAAIMFSLFRYSFEYVREEIRQYRYTKERDFKKIVRAFRTPLAIVLIPFIGYLVVSNIPEPDYNDPAVRIKVGEKYGNSQLIYSGYSELIKKDPLNSEWHYRFFKEIDKERDNKNIVELGGIPFRHYYDSLFAVQPYHDIAAFGMGLVEFVEYANYDRALEFLELAKDSTLPFLNYTIANVYFNKGDVEKGVAYHIKEIESGGYKLGSIYYLADFYLNHKMYDEAYSLVKYDPFLQYLPLTRMREEVFVPRGDVDYYFLSYVMRHVRKFSLFGFLGSLFVLGAWIFYLQKLDIFSSIPLKRQLVAVLLGMLFVFLVYPLSDVMDHYLADFFSRKMINFFVMTVVRIGMVEELVKLIPLLLIMWFTKWFKDPYDYIFYACSSALGFAFLENIIYSADYGTHIISSRAMVAVVMHMICSSVIAYAIILAKYKNIGNVALNTILGLIIASLIHGLYDFLIMAKMPVVLTFLFFFIIVINWRRIINNAINNSRYFNVDKIKHFSSLEFYVVVLLIGILTTEYVLNAMELDADAANQVLSGNFIKNGYLSIYLAVSIGKVDIFPGYWQKLGFPKNLSSLIVPKGINPLNFIGYDVKLRFSKNNINLAYLKTASGKIIRRLILSEEKDWFLIKTDKPFVYEGAFYYHLMINFKTPEVQLKENAGVKATIRLPLETLSEEQIEFSKKTTLWVGHCLVQKMP